MTYSICALDPATGDLGVAVQTRWFNVGSVVPWVEAGVGAVATQSFTRVEYGYHGLRLMREGRPPADALRELVATDADEAVRQVGMVDATGRSAAHTGLRCVRFASHLVAPGVSVQANMMERPSVPASMLSTFVGSGGDLASRLMAALRAAEREGGDVRGRQSAAIVVAPGALRLADSAAPAGGAGAPGSVAEDARATPGPPDPWARLVDLRVEDHRAPVDELSRLLDLYRAYDAMDEAEQASLRGDGIGAAAATARSVVLAPGDDQVVLWSAVSLAMSGRIGEARDALRRATAAEPRSAEHLRRFAEAGHLPGGDGTLEALGLSKPGQTDATDRLR